jgi:hypothetical protein
VRVAAGGVPVTDQELKALVDRLEELKRMSELIVTETQTILENVKRSKNRNKQAAEDDWASESGGQKQGD